MVKFKKVVIIFVLVFSCKSLFAQTTIQEPSQSTSAIYRLFRTTNRWTFIKLDTITGRMWQVQYDTEGDGRGSVVLNSQDLASGKERLPGRFTLYPTQNMWTFILIDQIDGGMWQIQWSQERRNRLVLPIE
jgi:phenylpyruvate tautomerase PptA (4-oxalocrotonate tautomerase family)